MLNRNMILTWRVLVEHVLVGHENDTIVHYLGVGELRSVDHDRLILNLERIRHRLQI